MTSRRSATERPRCSGKNSRRRWRRAATRWSNTPGPDVLRVNASVVDLDVVAAAGASDTGPGYIVSTADMSLVAELRDSQSGAMLARVADRKRQGRNQGNLQLSGQAAQTADARAAFALWAGYLREALDEARKPPPK